ncbi:aldo/keto reductase [Clostridium transplantifaecale]|uniref:aldo/keto reductase n=1 Tax=Clostridium transplantifaecale TaxID=2479838 RepID=UPI000F6400F2|nr:aldo/keto reductase [Clostridium transplantifaecale]
MYYRKFHDLNISALGLGALRLPMEPGNTGRIDRKEAQRILDLSFTCGINYIDTAYTYQNGDSERFLGEALSGYPRDSYYLATKFYAAANPDIEQVFEEQLKRLRTDYIDFYLFHGMDENFISAYMDKERNYLGYLLKQKEAGRIRYLGFSSHGAPDTLTRFLDWYDGFDMALVQMNYLDWTMLEAAKQYDILTNHGIPVWVMEPLKGGRLSGLNREAAEILKAAAPERSLSSWAFRFLMGLQNVQTVLSGMSSAEQLLDNVRTFEKPDPLSPSEQEVLKRAAGVFLKDLGVPCSGCRYCCPVCPAGLDIPLLIKGYNERRISGETWRIASLGRAAGPEHCLGCGACRKHCPQKIDIPGIMKQSASLLAGKK